VIYLACPYESIDPEIKKVRLNTANITAGYLMSMGFTVFSPLSHSTTIQDHVSTDSSHEFWMKQDLPILRDCNAIFVLKLEGWKESKGVTREIEEAKKCNIPIIEIESNLSVDKILKKIIEVFNL
jgi:hypothetical protein